MLVRISVPRERCSSRLETVLVSRSTALMADSSSEPITSPMQSIAPCYMGWGTAAAQLSLMFATYQDTESSHMVEFVTLSISLKGFNLDRYVEPERI